MTTSKPPRGVQIIRQPDPFRGQSLGCACGWDRELAGDRVHALRHLEWSYGVEAPTAMYDDAVTVVVVSLAAPMAWRRLAYHMAQLAQRDGDYDTVSLPYPAGRDQSDKDNTRALLYQRRGRCLGYLLTSEQDTMARWHTTDKTRVDGDPAGYRRRTTIGLAFVCELWRRQGIGSALVRAAAEHAHIATDDLAWASPFTANGHALAHRFTAADGAIWTA